VEQVSLEMIVNKLEQLEKRLETLVEQTQEVLCFDQAVKFLNISASQLYKMTCKRVIPFSKPAGKRIYFDRRQLVQWMLGRSKKTKQALQSQALEHLEAVKR
jgi:hypothetical protein